MRLRKGIFVIGIVLGVLTYSVPVLADSSTLIKLHKGISFQDDDIVIGSSDVASQSNDTRLLKHLDDRWGPSVDAPVLYDYYASGMSAAYYDAISLIFKLNRVGYDNIQSATLEAYIKTGEYAIPAPNEGPYWHHYALYEGAFSKIHEEDDPFLGKPYWESESPFRSFDYNDYVNGGWITHEVPLSWISGNNLDMTFRLWNASVDQVQLRVSSNPVPEPATMLLFGPALAGLMVLRKKRSA